MLSMCNLLKIVSERKFKAQYLPTGPLMTIE
jgi:hypothetical protein